MACFIRNRNCRIILIPEFTILWVNESFHSVTYFCAYLRSKEIEQVQSILKIHNQIHKNQESD